MEIPGVYFSVIFQDRALACGMYHHPRVMFAESASARVLYGMKRITNF